MAGGSIAAALIILFLVYTFLKGRTRTTGQKQFVKDPQSSSRISEGPIPSPHFRKIKSQDGITSKGNSIWNPTAYDIVPLTVKTAWSASDYEVEPHHARTETVWDAERPTGNRPIFLPQSAIVSLPSDDYLNLHVTRYKEYSDVNA